MRALSEAEELEVVARYQLGLTASQLAERFSTTDITIRRTLDRHGVDRRPRQERAGVTAEQVAELRTAGRTWAEIAELAGCSITTARNRWREVSDTGS
jgi:DNA-directed RNA polymerase specialized sigma24 family protein